MFVFAIPVHFGWLRRIIVLGHSLSQVVFFSRHFLGRWSGVKTKMLLSVRTVFRDFEILFTSGSLLIPCCSIFCFFWSFQCQNFFQFNFNISRHLLVLLDNLHPDVVVPTLPCFLIKNTTYVNVLSTWSVRRAGPPCHGHTRWSWSRWWYPRQHGGHSWLDYSALYFPC